MGILCFFVVFFLIYSEKGLLFVVVHGLSLRGLLLWGTGAGPLDFSRDSSQAQWSRLVALGRGAQQLWCAGLGAPRRVQSSWTRD